MCMSTPSAPAPAARLPEAPRPPDAGSNLASTEEARRRRAQGGLASTILTGPRGVGDTTSTGAGTGKTLLGT